jgi:hypothetical protein
VAVPDTLRGRLWLMAAGGTAVWRGDPRQWVAGSSVIGCTRSARFEWWSFHRVNVAVAGVAAGGRGGAGHAPGPAVAHGSGGDGGLAGRPAAVSG